jgi:hypothetical protein
MLREYLELKAEKTVRDSGLSIEFRDERSGYWESVPVITKETGYETGPFNEQAVVSAEFTLKDGADLAKLRDIFRLEFGGKRG